MMSGHNRAGKKPGVGVNQYFWKNMGLFQMCCISLIHLDVAFMYLTIGYEWMLENN